MMNSKFLTGHATIEFNNIDEAIDHAMKWGGWIAQELNTGDLIRWYSSKYIMNEVFDSLPKGRSFSIGPWSNFIEENEKA